ncbi:MAG: hypothetical protein AB8B87_00575 [Granulosicoccus sp.]
MPDPISSFFDAWQIDSADERHKTISSVVTSNVQYDDPRTPKTVNGVDALSEYVGMFSANAPGWTAKAVKTDTTAGISRATVSFSGMGPDGKEMVQLGQYFVETDGNLISRMVGFVGTGAQE